MTGLLGSTVLEVAIGVAFIYLLLAIFCTTANEWIAAVLKSRGKLLQQGILQLLAPDKASPDAAAQDPVVANFYNHPLIKSLIRDSTHPSYVPAVTFAKTIMDLATPNQPGSINFEDLENGIKKDLPPGSLQTSLLAVIQGTDKKIESAQKAIETWYEDHMNRVSGWYKRKTQLWTLIVAAIVTVATNADTLHIAKRLWLEPTLRSEIVEAAKTPPNPQPPQSSAGTPSGQTTTPLNPAAAPSGQTTVPAPTASAPAPPPSGQPSAKPAGNTAAASSEQDFRTLGLVLGWEDAADQSVSGWIQRIVGWLLTVLAVSLGAPFWFDVLNKFMNVRTAGKSPAEQKKETPA